MTWSRRCVLTTVIEFAGADVAFECLVERGAILVGKSLEPAQVGFAHLAAGHVADAQEGEVVALVDKAQVGEGILDFGAVEEADAAPDDVVDAGANQGLFDISAQVAGAIKDGEVAEGRGLLLLLGAKLGSDINRRRANGGKAGGGDIGIVGVGAERADLGDDPAGFLFVAASVEMGYLGAAAAGGEEILGDAVAVAADDRIGNVENGGGGAIVLVEDDGLVVLELDEHLGTSATPLVDGLVGVAHDEEVVVDALQRFDDGPVALVARRA